MNSNEWPLVFFTVLSQISLGLIVAGLVMYLTHKQVEMPFVGVFRKYLITTALIAMVVALAISFLHLTSPLHSVYAMSNLATSWLSREILLASIFCFTLVVCYTSISFKLPHPSMFQYLYLAALITGGILIWTMAKLYMIPTVPAWNHASTPIAFFNTAIIGGGGMALVLITFLAGRGTVPPNLQSLQTILFVMVGIGVLIHLLNSLLIQPDLASVAGSFPIPEVASWIKVTMVVVLLLGVTSLTWWFYNIPAGNQNQAFFVYSGVALLLMAELLGRYIFYASHYRVGI